MSQIVAIQARGLLRQIGRQATIGAMDLKEALEAAYDALVNSNFRAGRIFMSTSGNGQSASFIIPQQYTAAFAPDRLAQQFQEYIEIYDDSVANGLITDSTAIESDIAVMLADDRLQTVSARRIDITGIRFPGGAIVAQ